MSETVKLLQCVYENAAMGKDAVKHLLAAAEDREMEQLLIRHLDGYSAVSAEARRAIEQRGRQAEKIGPAAKLSSRMTIGLRLLRDRSASHMAQMLAQGCTMGMKQLSGQMKALPAAAPGAKRLGRRLLAMEREQREQWRAYRTEPDGE